MNEIEDSTTRISTLVGAAKQYSQLDRAPYQVVDVHELLDSTLVMLAGKIGDGIQVVKDYDRTLPPIPVYAGRAQPGLDEPDRQRGLRDGRRPAPSPSAPARDEDRVLVEIGDTGPGRARRRSGTGSSSRSSPPSRSARAPASAWTSPGASW